MPALKVNLLLQETVSVIPVLVLMEERATIMETRSDVRVLPAGVAVPVTWVRQKPKHLHVELI